MNIKIYYAFCNPHLHNKLKHNVQNWKKKLTFMATMPRNLFVNLLPWKSSQPREKPEKIQCSLGLNNLSRLDVCVHEFYQKVTGPNTNFNKNTIINLIYETKVTCSLNLIYVSNLCNVYLFFLVNRSIWATLGPGGVD